MNRCKCGSYAINKDPDRKLCDVCHAYITGFREARERAAKHLDDHRLHLCGSQVDEIRAIEPGE